MSERTLRRITLLYPFLMLLCGLGYARWDSYQMDGDAVSFVDIADAIQHHNWPLVINGYWNPAYAAALAVGNILAHPTRWNALQVDFYVNFVIFAFAIAAVTYFVRAVLRIRESNGSDESFALPQEGVLLFAWAVVFYSWQRELSIGKVRSDGLLLVFLVVAAALMLRLFATGRVRYAVALGLALGGAYLTKSFGFLASLVLLFALFLCGLLLRKTFGKKIASGALLSAMIFLLVCAPYIAGISLQRDRLTFGDSSRLAYAWIIDGMGSAHEWNTGPIGNATEQLKHHERLILSNPAVYAYDEHLNGTFPLWFDTAWWHDKTVPRIVVAEQAIVITRNLVLGLRFLQQHPEPLVFLFVLFLCGGRLPSRFAPWIPYLLLAGWAVFMFVLYLLVLIQDRYISAAWILIVVPLAAAMRNPIGKGHLRPIAVALALLLAGLSLTDAVQDLAQKRRTLSPAGHHGAYDENIYSAAQGLVALGIKPGDRVACVGLHTCGTDPYWAWLAGVQTVADVDGADDARTVFWNKIPNKAAVVQALRSVKAKALVIEVLPGDGPPPGWSRLGDSAFFACDPQAHTNPSSDAVSGWEPCLREDKHD
ncbi:MAG: ArnT family glycosyltransferase [Acidobacteriaceae bacterium]